jgi:hypothetical protein
MDSWHPASRPCLATRRVASSSGGDRLCGGSPVSRLVVSKLAIVHQVERPVPNLLTNHGVVSAP